MPLIEWLFEQRGFCTQQANLQANCLDLELFNQPQAYRAFARVYLNGRIPVNAVYDVLNSLQGKVCQKDSPVRLWRVQSGPKTCRQTVSDDVGHERDQ